MSTSVTIATQPAQAPSRPGRVGANAANASGGTGPYTYQWYRGLTSAFTINAASSLPGQTSQQLVDQAPNGSWYYAVVATDSLASSGHAYSSSALLIELDAQTQTQDMSAPFAGANYPNPVLFNEAT